MEVTAITHTLLGCCPVGGARALPVYQRQWLQLETRLETRERLSLTSVEWHACVLVATRRWLLVLRLARARRDRACMGAYGGFETILY